MPVLDLFKGSKAPQSGKKYEEIPTEYIYPNPGQPRTVFDDDALEELAQSIQQVGLIQPLLVRRIDDRHYELIAGERRLRAVKKIGMKTVPCIIQAGIDEEESALMAIIENLQRENLSYMEEARCYAQMLERYSLTQEQLAMRLGKSQSSIANKLRLLKLPASVATAATEAGLSERHARELIRLNDEEEQLRAIEIIKERNMSVKETERYVTKRLDDMAGEGKQVHRRPIVMRIMKDYRAFMNSINSAVEILRDAGLDVVVIQKDRDDGVDISISVTHKN